MVECHWEYCHKQASMFLHFPFGTNALCGHHAKRADRQWTGDFRRIECEHDLEDAEEEEPEEIVEIRRPDAKGFVNRGSGVWHAQASCAGTNAEQDVRLEDAVEEGFDVCGSCSSILVEYKHE